jgi:hypothetical protein
VTVLGSMFSVRFGPPATNRASSPCREISALAVRQMSMDSASAKTSSTMLLTAPKDSKAKRKTTGCLSFLVVSAPEPSVSWVVCLMDDRAIGRSEPMTRFHTLSSLAGLALAGSFVLIPTAVSASTPSSSAERAATAALNQNILAANAAAEAREKELDAKYQEQLKQHQAQLREYEARRQEYLARVRE